jgi:hypothetical protein
MAKFDFLSPENMEEIYRKRANGGNTNLDTFKMAAIKIIPSESRYSKLTNLP